MYELKSRVRYSEADAHGVLTTFGLMNYLQDCCTMQAEDLDIGLEYLAQRHMGWIVTTYEIKILNPLPKVGDEIIVKTWPYKFRGMLGYRNFTMETPDGTTLVEADSLWVLMDIEAGKPVRIPEDMAKAYKTFPQLSGEWDLRRKVQGHMQNVKETFEVSKMYIDTNGHMNNAYYPEMACRVRQGTNSIKKLWIQFKKSALLGQEVLCSSACLGQEEMVTLYNQDREEYCLVCFE